MSKVVLLIELPGGDTVAVPFANRERADAFEERCPFEVVGRPPVMTQLELRGEVEREARSRHTWPTRRE